MQPVHVVVCSGRTYLEWRDSGAAADGECRQAVATGTAEVDSVGMGGMAGGSGDNKITASVEIV